MYTISLKPLIFIIILILFQLACRTRTVSEVKVVNGQDIPLTAFPEVFQLYRIYELETPNPQGPKHSHGAKWKRCSSVAIAPHLLLTAAHCLCDEQDKYGSWKFKRVGLMQGKFVAHRYISSEAFRCEDMSYDHHDIAVLVFPKSCYQNQNFTPFPYLEIRENPLKDGGKVQVVGFGSNNSTNYQNAGIKRLGTNYFHLNSKAKAWLTQGFIMLTRSPQNDFSVTASGDSGGPLISEGKLAGITNASITKNQTTFARYIDIRSKWSQAFLQKITEDYPEDMKCNH